MILPSVKPASLAALVACAILAILPYWLVAIPPGTDLPQHLSQIVLARQILSGERTDMAFVPWYFAQTLIYAVVWVAMSIAKPLAAGKLVMSFLAASWLAGTFWLAHKLRRPLVSWLVTAPVVFNFLFSWGLLNFLVALPILCVFVERAISIRAKSAPKLADLATTGLLFIGLYYAHALVFLFANVFLTVLALLPKGRHIRILIITSIPAWALALAWYPTLAHLRAASGANVEVGWASMPSERITLDQLTNRLYGALQNPLEQVLTLLLLCWIALSLFQHRNRLSAAIHGPLALCGVMLIGLSVFIPDYYMNTIMFSARWMPLGACLLVLSLPAVKGSERTGAYVAIGAMALLSLLTAMAWQDREQLEQDGFLPALHALHTNDRILFFSSVSSEFIKGQPDLQAFAYAQAIYGNDIQFSFAEHYSGIVIPLIHRPRIVSARSMWAAALRAPKTGEFSAILVGADDETHRTLAAKLGLHSPTPPRTTWRLYRFSPTD